MNLTAWELGMRVRALGAVGLLWARLAGGLALGLCLIAAGGSQGAPTGAGPVTGTMDEVRLSKIARYTDTFSPACGWTTDANTVALWHLNEGRGTTVTDSSGHGHNGTLHGAPTPTWVDGVTCGKP